MTRRAISVRVLLALLLAGCASRALEPGEREGVSASVADGAVRGFDLSAPVDLAIPCSAAKEDFDSKVWPLLKMECGQCHATVSGGVGPGLLSSPDAFFAFLAGDPNLDGFFATTHPTGFISAELIAALKSWIAEYQQACRP